MPKVTAPQDAAKDPLDSAMEDLNKRFGPNTVFRVGATPRLRVAAISTGSLKLDAAIGIGGIPQGRVTEISGPEAGGKTTVALHIVANAQKGGGVAAFIDAEHALDPDYARALGVDMDALLLSQPDSGEEALEVADTLVGTEMLAVVVVDSVAALVPQAEIDGDMGDSHMALQARLMSQALRKLTPRLSAGTAVVFINQLRSKVGVFFGSSETTTGGKALPFYSSVRLDIRPVELLKVKDEQPFGRRVKVKVIKNKVSAPFRQAEVDIIFGRGLSREGELLDLGLEYGVLRKSGAYHFYGEQAIGQGREAARASLVAAPELSDRLEQDIRLAGLNRLMGLPVAQADGVPAAG